MKANSDYGLSNGNGHAKNGHSESARAIERRPGDIEDEIQVTRARMQSTIEAIRKDLSPGQLVDQVMHSVKEGKARDVASSTLHSVGSLVRENPLPAAVIGVGVVWLAASSQRSKHTVSSARVSRSYAEGAGLEQGGGGLYSEGELYGQEHHDPASAAAGFERAGTYGGSYESLEGADAEASHASGGGRLANAKERAGHIAHGAREKMGGARAKLSGVTHGAASKIGGAASATRHKAQAGAARAKQASVQQFDAQPLVIGAIAVGVGALLGSLIPSTRREDELLGAKRDEMKRKADEVGAQMLGRVKDTMEKGAEKAKSRLERGPQSGEGQQQGAAAGVAAGAFASSVAGDNVTGGSSAPQYATQASTGTFADRGDFEVPSQSGTQSTLDDDDVVDDPDTFGGP